MSSTLRLPEEASRRGTPAPPTLVLPEEDGSRSSLSRIGARSRRRSQQLPSFREVATSVALSNKFLRILQKETKGKREIRERRTRNRRLFYDETSFHALSYLGNAHRATARVFWFVVLFGGTGALLWSVQILLRGYLLTPSQVNVNLVAPVGLTLPEVTVCSMRRINKTKADAIGLNTTHTVDYLYGSFAQLVGFGFSDDEFEYFNNYVNVPAVRNQYMNAYYRWMRSSDNPYGIMDPGTGFGHMLKFLSQKCIKDETFRCMLAGVEVENCCSKLLHFRNYNGPCFRLAFLREFNQTVGGNREGLTTLYQPPPENIYVSSVFNVYTSKGLQLFFRPFGAGIELDPIFLAEGYEYSIALHIRQMRLLPNGISTCTTVQYLESNRTVIDPYPFCMYVCLSNLFMDTCGCKPINNLFEVGNAVSDVPYCGPEEVLTCVKVKDVVLKERNPRECTARCPYACTQFDYSASVSAVKLSTSSEHSRGLTTNNSRAIRFAVYYPRIQYTSFNEIETISIFNFFSNVGGALGLWTGASAVSILHVIKYMLYVVKVRRQRRRERRVWESDLRKAERAIIKTIAMDKRRRY